MQHVIRQKNLALEYIRNRITQHKPRQHSTPKNKKLNHATQHNKTQATQHKHQINGCLQIFHCKTSYQPTTCPPCANSLITTRVIIALTTLLMDLAPRPLTHDTPPLLGPRHLPSRTHASRHALFCNTSVSIPCLCLLGKNWHGFVSSKHLSYISTFSCHFGSCLEEVEPKNCFFFLYM